MIHQRIKLFFILTQLHVHNSISRMSQCFVLQETEVLFFRSVLFPFFVCRCTSWSFKSNLLRCHVACHIYCSYAIVFQIGIVR